MPLLLKTLGLILALLVLGHWLMAGQDNIIEGPPETPDVSSYESTTP
jgi:hypothetical protein